MAIRNVRRDVMHDLRELKEAGEAGSDDEHRAEVELQKVTDGTDRRARRAAQAQGSRDPGGLDGGLAVSRQPPWTTVHALATSPSSPTATAVGLSGAACPRSPGHEAGADTVKARLRDAVDLGIEELTVYSFSTENWTRPAAEVQGLMAMMARRIEAETPELHDEGVRMRFIGRRSDPVPQNLIERMEWAERPHPRERPDHAVRGLQLRRAGGNRRRSANLHLRHRGRLPRPPVRARHARSRPDHPHQRRAADFELPALAGGVLGAGCSATSCGRTSHGSRSKQSLEDFSARSRRFGGR